MRPIEERLASLSPEKRAEVYREVLRRDYRKSLFLTAQRLLEYRDINWPTHGDVIEALEDPQAKSKLIVMPRGTFKSSICCISYPIHLLMNNPNLRIFLTSEVYTNSKNLLREIKGKLLSERFTGLFGRWDQGGWNEGEIIVPRTVHHKEASITCGGVETVKVGQHYDVIIADDLNSDNNSATPEGCEKVRNYARMLTGILEPNGIIAFVGTRYSANDNIAHIIRDELSDEQRKYLRSLKVV